MLIYTLTATDFQFQNKRNDLCIISYREVINGYLQAAWRSSSKGGVFFLFALESFLWCFFSSSNCCAIFTACISQSVAQFTFVGFLKHHFILSRLKASFTEICCIWGTTTFSSCPKWNRFLHPNPNPSKSWRMKTEAMLRAIPSSLPHLPQLQTFVQFHYWQVLCLDYKNFRSKLWTSHSVFAPSTTASQSKEPQFLLISIYYESFERNKAIGMCCL